MGREPDQELARRRARARPPRPRRPGPRARRRRRAATARSGRSFSTKSAPCSSHSAAEGRCGGEDLLVGAVLLAQLEDVHAAGERLAQRVLAGARIGDEIEARLGESRRVGRHAAESSERGSCDAGVARALEAVLALARARRPGSSCGSSPASPVVALPSLRHLPPRFDWTVTRRPLPAARMPPHTSILRPPRWRTKKRQPVRLVDARLRLAAREPEARLEARRVAARR